MTMNLPQSKPVDQRVIDERAVVERAAGQGRNRLEPIVNPARWAKQAVGDQDCQKQVDTKAFTGRGSLLELRQLLTSLARTTAEMRQMVESMRKGGSVGIGDNALLLDDADAALLETEPTTRALEPWELAKYGQMRLVLHVKHTSGLTFLRWRDLAGKCKHVPWPTVHERIAMIKVAAVRDWFYEQSEKATRLNEEHKEFRRTIATARKVVMRGTPHVFAKPVRGGAKG